MKTEKNRCDMLTATSTGNKAGSGVLDQLQTTIKSVSDAEQQRITVIQAAMEKCLD
jgi:hypothetical protein